MGLLNEINNLNKTLEYKNKKELTKTQQKELDKLKKERIKNIFFENLEYLYNKTANKNDIEILTSNIIKNKIKNIDIIESNYYDKYKTKLNKTDIDFIDQHYFKFIQDIKKEYDYIYKIEEVHQKEEEKKQKELLKIELLKEKQNQQQQQLKQQNTIQILKTITFLLLSPFILIIFFVYGICKYSK